MKKILPLLALISFLGAGSLIVFAAIGPAGTVKCADEKGICTLSGSTRIAYGANGVFYYKTVPAGTVFVTCDNVTFGDPVYGVVKACYKETLLTQILLPWKNNQGGNVEEKQSNGYLVMAGASKEVTVNYTTPSILNECKKITATTKNIFVPSLTLTEWTKFKAGIGSVGGTITNCVASPVVGYGWDVGTWGVCNAECGTSTNQYRTVQCRELTSLSPKVFGNVVSDTYCSAVAKPIDVQGCIGSNNCPVCNMNGVQDNGETGVDCGGGNCGACGQLQQNISGPSVQCISFGPSTYYKINYYTQTNPDLGLIQDQTYNVAGLGNASFQGYGPLNLTASWAQPVTPIIAYNNPGCNTPDPVCSNGATNPPLCNDIIGEPIDGGWSGWGACIPKDGICGDGLQRRTCNNPSPANGGADCIGRNTQDCQANSCIPPLPGPLNCGTQTKSIMIDLGGEGGGTSFSTESFTAYNGDSWYTSQSDCYPTVCTCDSTSCSILHQPNTLACEGWGGGYDGDGDGDGDGEGGDGEGN